MKIKLMEDHTQAGVEYKAGEEIEVDKATYDFIMGYYMSKREAEVLRQNRIAEELAKPLVEKKSKGSK